MRLILGRIQVSDEDFDFAIKLNLSISHYGYAVFWFEGKVQFLHSVITQRAGKVLQENQVWDHMDRNRLNDARWNLRPATRKQSQLNKSIRVDNTSGYLGVSWCSHHKGWYASVNINGRRQNLSCYKTKEEAAKVRDRRCYMDIHNREFYVYNFPSELDFSSLKTRLQFHLEKGTQ